MTRIEEIEQKLREAVADFKLQVNEVGKALAELKENKKEGKWKPSFDDEFWFRGINGASVSKYYLYADNDSINWIINNLPIFKTKEQCDRYWHFMDTVKEKSYEFSKEEWEDDRINKYFIKYFYADKTWFTQCTLRLRSFGEIYFKDEESAQYIIDNFKDELMEYWI